MIDTPKKISDAYKKMIMSRTPSERMRMASGMFDAARGMAIAGIKEGGKELNDLDLRKKLFVRFYSKDFTDKEMTNILSRLRGGDQPLRGN